MEQSKYIPGKTGFDWKVKDNNKSAYLSVYQRNGKLFDQS